MCFGRKKSAKDGSDLPNARHLRPPAEIRTSFRSLDFSGSSFSSLSEKSDSKPYMISPCPSPCTTTTNLILPTKIVDDATLEQRDAFITPKRELIDLSSAAATGRSYSTSTLTLAGSRDNSSARTLTGSTDESSALFEKLRSYSVNPLITEKTGLYARNIDDFTRPLERA